MKKLISTTFASLLFSIGYSQCSAGEVEVTIDVGTDAYGYEIYWELVPGGNACGTGTIFAGGNLTVGCTGGGLQAQDPGGYGNNTTITEGPWCLIDGNTYDIISVDDWGDGGADFTVKINGFTSNLFNSAGTGGTFTFLAVEPAPYDAGVDKVTTYPYVNPGSIDIEAVIRNWGSTTITSLDIEYSINAGAPVTTTITGLNILPFAEETITHDVPWVPSANGLYNVEVTTGDVNGNTDSNPLNNDNIAIVEVGDPRGNIISQYQGITPIFTVIGNSTNGISDPTDLEFHNVLSKNELWVVNRGTEGSGSRTITFSNTGEAGQTSINKQDGNAWHFMSLTTGLAFSENTNFATSPGIYDANHNGGAPFTGPSLWSSDMAIYAEPSGGNGSHLDMIHESPYSQGIAYETDNVFWVFDGNSNDIVRYDFADDHGPGNSDHDDGRVTRYALTSVAKDPNDIIASHLDLDDETGWLYVVDHGNDRIFRMDINTGVAGGSPSFGPYETLAQYEMVTGYIWENVVTTGLDEPSGLAIIGNKMLVTDHANGDIIVYLIDQGVPFTELFRIETGTPGIMGIEIGPDGRIFYVNEITNEVVRIDGSELGIENEETNISAELSLYPNPAKDFVHIQSKSDLSNAIVTLYSQDGKLIETEYSVLSLNTIQINTNELSAGIYIINVINAGEIVNMKFIVQ